MTKRLQSILLAFGDYQFANHTFGYTSIYALWIILGGLLVSSPLIVAYKWKSGTLPMPRALGLLVVSLPLAFVGVQLLAAFDHFVD